MPSAWSPGGLFASVVIVAVCVAAFAAALNTIGDTLDGQIDYYTQEARKRAIELDIQVSLGYLALLALVPAVVIGIAVWLIDRWEPEPAVIYAIAVGWGAGVSIVLSLVGNRWWAEFVDDLVPTATKFTRDVLVIAVGAGVVEEAAKGLGIFLVFYLLNRYINGPLDGIVIGLLIGVGFAFTENILYFGRAAVNESLLEQVGKDPGDTSVESLFVLRAVLTPFVHPLATAITGLFVGIASTQRRPGVVAIPLGLVGYLFAATLHGLHNFSAVKNFAVEPAQRVLLQLPAYIGAAVLIYVTSQLQRRATFRGLVEYSRAGWLSHNEIAMVMSLANRGRGRAWAAASVAERGGLAKDGRKAMRRFQTEIIQLGYSRTINLDRRTAHTPAARKKEAEHLELITSSRKVFAEVQKATLSLSGSGPGANRPPGQSPPPVGQPYSQAPDPRFGGGHLPGAGSVYGHGGQGDPTGRGRLR